MTPFYDDGVATLYHGDARDVLPAIRAELEPIVIITDPPYGIAYSSGWARDLVVSYVSDDGSIAGDADLSVRDDVLALVDGLWPGWPGLVFGSWRMPPPERTTMALVWDKGEAAGMGNLALPWKPNHEMVYVVGSDFRGSARRSGVLRADNLSRVSMGRRHPHEKPVKLLHQLLEGCPPEWIVVDPFAGSGTTLRAAKDYGRRCIGIEAEEKYCKVAAGRLGQDVLPFEETTCT